MNPNKDGGSKEPTELSQKTEHGEQEEQRKPLSPKLRHNMLIVLIIAFALILVFAVAGLLTGQYRKCSRQTSMGSMQVYSVVSFDAKASLS